MVHFFTLVESILILVVLISTTFWLKSRGIIGDSVKGVFSKMTTDYALPALIFSSLATQTIHLEQLLPAAVMLAATLIVMVIAFFLGKRLKLQGSRLGVFMVLSGFGSSSTLGYPLIKQMYPNNAGALCDAMVTGELGSCLPFFIIGVAIVMYFGNKDKGKIGLSATLIPFLKSPIFISMVLGVIFAFLNIPPANIIFSFFYKIITIISASLVIFVAISVGLMLKPVKIKTLIPLILAIAFLKLIIDPLIAIAGTNLFHMPELQSEVLTIETAMPSGVVVSVIADRYGCDGKFASIVVIITYFLALLTIPLMFLLDVY